MNSMGTIVNIVAKLESCRLDLKYSHHTDSKVTEVMDMLISLAVVIFHNVNLKYIQIFICKSYLNQTRGKIPNLPCNTAGFLKSC